MPSYVWPLSGTATAPDLNTSFGPRINRQQRDFHDGIDLRAPIGTPVVAMCAGDLHRAGPAGTHGFSSRHLVLKVNDPKDGIIYLVHLHLATIATGITEGATVHQRQVIGTVGVERTEQVRLNCDTSVAELRRVEVGITRLSSGGTATMLVDDVRVTEATALIQ
jgi:Peptidase family M23